MANKKKNTHLMTSLAAHAALLLYFLLGFDFSTSHMLVAQNTNKNDVISAVVLGDTLKSKMMPQEEAKPKPIPEPVKEPVKVAEIEPKVKVPPPPPPEPKSTPKPVQPPVPKKDVVILKVEQKKKLAENKAQEEKKRRDQLAKDLLAELEQVNKQKKVKQKELKTHFAETLRQQAEKSMREQMFEEEFHLNGMDNRKTQGIVSKYKALILQAIGERWIIPPQTDKKLYCILMIRLAPGGTVLDVQLAKGSGNNALDSSAIAAVFKASPLPVPKDPDAFEPFRQFALRVKLEGLMQS